MENLNVATAPKTDLCQFRINPEIKEVVTNIFAQNGLTLTDAINVFLQQSINANGLPFLVSQGNVSFMRQKATKRLLAELQKGLDSETVSEEEAERLLGVANEA